MTAPATGDSTSTPDQGEPLSPTMLLTVYSFLRARRLTVTDGTQEIGLPDLMALWREYGPQTLPPGSVPFEPCEPPTPTD